MVRSGQIVARGRNKRVQENDPVMHGETDCLRNAGLMEDYNDTEMYTTLSPCMMCTGAILHFGIKRVVIGENINFPGNIELLLDFGVKVALADDPACKNLMAQFIRKYPELWFEDIAGRSHT
ncbi:Cytosine deaminase [Geodia barretti]|nr:Cytosine deaminase [Geodia barretti]